MEPETITLRDGREVFVRSSGLGDGPAVLAYIKALGESTEFILTHPGDTPDLGPVEERIEWIAQGKFYSLVAIDPQTNEVVANAAYTFSPRVKLAHVGDLGIGVLPAWRGAGLASLMLRRSIEDMRANPKIHKLELTTMVGNDHALRMYERAGFVVEGIKRRSIRQPDGAFNDEIMMGLWVGEEEGHD